MNNTWRDLYDRQQIAHATLKGQHTLASNLYFDWTADYSRATLNRPDEATLNVDGGLLKDNNQQPSPVVPILQNSDREFTHSTDEDKSGYANLTYKSTIGDVRIDWTAGGMYRDKHRTA